MKRLRRLFYRIFPRYRRIEVRLLTYSEADTLIRANEGKPESLQWTIAPEEDHNRFGAVLRQVWLERRERITE